MTLVRVTVAGTIGKAVRINTDATIGSQIGVDFQLPDGTTPTLEELADALYVAAPPAEFVSDTDSSAGHQVFESEIIDDIILARVADDEVITGAWTFNTNLTMSNGIPINWKSQVGAKVQFLNLSAGAGVSGEVGHARVASATSQQTTSGTYVNFTAGVIPHASLVNNEDYLVFVRGVTSNLTSQSTPLNGARLTYNGTEVANSEMLYESKNGTTNDNGHPYQWSGIVNSGTVGDLQLQFKSGNGGVDTVDMGFVTMLMIKVSDLTLNTNIFFDSDTGLVELDDGNFPPTSPFDLGVSITIGDDASDYLVFGCVGIGDFTTGGNTVQIDLLKDGGSAKKLGEYVRADNSDEIPMGLVGFYEAPATGTVLTLTGVGTGFPVDKKYAFLAAIRMNAFAEVHKKYVASGPVLSGFPGDTDIATINVTTTLASNNWCFFGSVTEDWVGSSQSEHTLIRANIGGAGDATQAGDPVWRLISDGTDRTVSRFMISDDVIIGASVTIDADLQIGHPTSAGSDILTETILLAFTWELKTGDEFAVGDSAFLTTIHGTRVDIDATQGLRILDSTGNDSVTFSHDGVDLNVVGVTTVDINITGITSIQAGTVDADFDAITGTSFAGILAANLLDKTAIETVSAEWTFTDAIHLEHTATEPDDHAFDLDVDAAGFGDVKALDIDYITGAIAIGQDEAVILVNIDEFAATGGDVAALEVLVTEGSARIFGLLAGALVAPIMQLSGVFVNADLADVDGVEKTTELSSGGAGAITLFVADDDFVIVGSAAKFEEIEFILSTGASGAGIKPTFEFSTGVGTWSTFTPVDGTSAMRHSGVLEWLDSDIPTWAFGNASNEYLIRVTRTRNTLVTKPVADLVRIAAITEYSWDALGDLTVNDIVATSYDGVLAANLLDKTAAETIPGNWTWEGRLVTDDSTTTRAGFNIPTGVAPTSPVQGDMWITATDIFARINGVSESLLSTAAGSTIRIGHTYGIGGEVVVPAGDVDFIHPFFVSLASGHSAKLVKVRHKINAGTSVTCKLQKNGVDVTGFTGMVVTTTASDTDPADVVLVDNDKLALVVTGVADCPTNMSFTLLMEHTGATIRAGHTYSIPGEVKVPSGDVDFINPFFASLTGGGHAIKLVKARHRINSGTSVTCKLQKNGVDITGFTSISVTTSDTDTDPTDVVLADDDKIALVVTGVSGTPKNMSFTLFFEHAGL